MQGAKKTEEKASVIIKRDILRQLDEVFVSVKEQRA